MRRALRELTRASLPSFFEYGTRYVDPQTFRRKTSGAPSFGREVTSEELFVVGRSVLTSLSPFEFEDRLFDVLVCGFF